jgi:hypothetical protein
VDDTPGSIRVDHPQFEVYAWPDRARLMGRHEAAVPRGNGACRNLGFFIAWKEGEQDEIVVALDDDCAVESPGFVTEVESLLGGGTRPVVSGSGRHFNIFDLYDDPGIRAQFPRGFPYSARVGYQPWTASRTRRAGIRMNIGLWRGVLDINGVDRIAAEKEEFPRAGLRTEGVVVPPGVLVSACSGSMQFSRDVVPAVYQLPMNVAILPGWTINRFGDIWGGFVLKTLMDRRGDSMSVGRPLVHHARVGPAPRNARQEHLAQLVNEEFIELLERAAEEVRPRGYLDMMGDLREGLLRRTRAASPVLRVYLGELNRSLRAWIAALGPPVVRTRARRTVWPRSSRPREIHPR